MGLIAYTSQTYDALLEKWISHLLSEHRHFGPHETRIVVPNHRVANWLNRSLSTHVGISMNLRFVYFESLIAEWIAPAQGSEPSDTDNTALTLEWVGILWEGFRSGELRHFLSETAFGAYSNSELHWMQLAWEYVSILQLYGQHRPQWLLAWERGQDRTTQTAESVFETLQKTLYQFLMEHGASPHPFTRVTTSNNTQTIPRSSHLHFFGFWGFPLSKWKMIEQMSHAGSIFLYIPFPTEGYLADLTRKNLQQPLLLGDDGLRMGPNYQLLSKLGQRGRALQMLLLDETVDTDACFDSRHHSENDRRLHALQAQITNPDTFESFTWKAPADADPSIQIHSVCNRRREVEVVKAIIQCSLLQIPDLELESIHVYAPDISTYAPLISDVFSSDSTQNSIAYSVQNAVDGESVPGIKVIVDLFRLLQSDWKAADVIEWLSSEPLRQTMEFSLAEIELITQWIAKAGIFRGNPSQPGRSHDAYSWETGMEKLMQAYAGQLLTNPLGNTNFDIDPPSQHGATFSKFCNCYGFMKQAAKALISRKQNLGSYRFHISWLIAKVIPSGYEFEKQVILSTTNRLVEHFPAELEMELNGFVYLLKKTLPKLPPPQALSRKSGVQFASIQFEDMTPCRVRIMMGMNEGEFPSVEVSQSHNLLNSLDSEASDPSRKEDQRYWLLQSIQQTSERWIATYQGQDASGNASRLLSPAVEAIIQSVNRLVDPDSFGNHPSSSLLVKPIQHSRFAYDRRNFVEHPIFPHFSTTDYHTARQLETRQRSHFDTTTLQNSNPPPPLAKESVLPQQITIWDLADFFSHPNKFVCEQHLGIKFPNTHDFSPDHEPLFWAGMEQSYSLRTDILRIGLKGLDRSALESVLDTYHALLPGSLQDIGMEWACSEIQSMGRLQGATDFQLLENTALISKTTLLDSGIQLKHAAFEDKIPAHLQLATIRASTLNAKHKLEAWVHLLAFWVDQSIEERRSFTLITKDKRFQLSPPDTPLEILQSLVSIFQAYQTRPVPFFPNTSEVFSKKDLALESVEHSSQWDGEYGEKRDPYHEYMFRQHSPFTPEFEQLARKVFDPLNTHGSTGASKGGNG